MQVKNFYKEIPEDESKKHDNPHFSEHNIKIPFRMLVVGASGSMKTNTALDVIEKFADTFFHITICCRYKDEPLYKLLQDSLPNNQLKIIEVAGEDLSGLPPVNNMQKTDPHTLVIFDDLVLVKDQSLIEEYFIRARKGNCSLMYLTQSYYKAPKTIRGQLSSIILKKIASIRDLDMILREYSLGVTVDQLKAMYFECTKTKLDWLMIALENAPGKQFFHNYELMSFQGDDQNHQIDEDEAPDNTEEKNGKGANPNEQEVEEAQRIQMPEDYTSVDLSALIGTRLKKRKPKAVFPPLLTYN